MHLDSKGLFDHAERVVVSGRSFATYKSGDTGPLVVLLHGAGHTSLSWGFAAQHMKSECRLVAIDFRGHGGTMCDPEDEADLSALTLAQDCVDVLHQLLGQDEAVVLVGHSVGGAIASRVAASGKLKVSGIVVIDAVEETAVQSLEHLMPFLQQRPALFDTKEQAVEWTLAAGLSRRPAVANRTVPAQLVQTNDGYKWRTDLMAAQSHWRGWFEGLSTAFLSVPAPKLLVLAGNDRLDTTLLVGQMSGKFQLVILPVAGHMIQEDEPEQVATALLKFINRLQKLPTVYR